jgi:hypothetical protein
MKRAGIFTFHSVNNFGAVLQSYALCEYINRLGIKAEIVDFRDYFRNFINNDVNGYYARNYLDIIRGKLSFELFRIKYLKRSKPVNSLNEHFISKYNYCIAGSDQLWNPYIYKENTYFLPFKTEGTVKIAYAPSIGADITSPDFPIANFSKYIPDFDFVSVREQRHVEFVQQFTEKKVERVCDPTLLLDETDYKRLMPQRRKKYKYILYYLFDYNPLSLHLTQKIAKRHGYKIIYFSSFANKQAISSDEEQSFFYKGPGEFLWLIKNAELIVTHSYHATIFSVIFNKPFFSIPKAETSSRIETLSSVLGFKDRVITGFKNTDSVDIEMDFSDINLRLADERAKGAEFLKKALGVGSLA